MNDQDDKLDHAVSALPDAIMPERDLWPGIEARLTKGRGGFWQWRVAASVFAATVLVGLLIIPPSDTGQVAELAPSEVPASDPELLRYRVLALYYAGRHADQVAGLAPSEVPATDPELLRYSGLDAEFVRVHDRSLEALEDQLAALSPATREVVIANLKIIRASIADINEAIEREPNNVQLRQLLRMAYQQELAIVNGIRRSAPTLERTTT